ncbi:conserved hypothetical protein [uncultured Defluviicoccus sp.]|uniref:Aminoglycoside phosphotransferase domain-containing protein n=1 Tax=metagenome TaxID=256318 RepID=A0A380T7J3_9ZZZZ|nr:conserved hypothetical protein [uncultured Defluviicoccus sp.]
MLDIVRDDTALQADIIRAIETGAVQGIPRPTERFDTHLSHVFLSGDRAYKLKRAIRLPFVDFHESAQRRAACEAELAVNQRLGSPFYLEVAGIGRKGGSFVLTNSGDALEWVVIMKRFDTSHRFDVLAANGQLSPEQVEATASMIAEMHAAAPVSRVAGHAADYRQIIRTLRRTEEEGAAALGLSIDGDLFDRLDAELSRLDPLIENRRALGKVRRVHGDLHLRNLCVFEGRPVPFDALEFDERMATIDVLYDLAFLLMDLRRLSLRREANAAMNRYWDVARESECGLAVLPFFMALRASVRMAVAVEEGALELAKEYRSLAFELLSHPAPASVAIGGLSGTGKSALARELAPMMAGPAGARIVRSDVVRKNAIGIGLTQAADAAAYVPARRSQVYRDLLAHASTARKVGASVIIDATFKEQQGRDSLAAIFPDISMFWLEAPLSVRLQRVQARRGDASDADTRVAAAQETPANLGQVWRRLDARLPLPVLAKQALEHLA